MTKTLTTLFFFSSTIRPQGSLLEKSRASGPGAEGIVRVGKLKLVSLCFFCVCANYLGPRETIAPVVRVSCFVVVVDAM